MIFLILGEEKNLVEDVFKNAIDCLSDEDKKLPQVFNLVAWFFVITRTVF